MVEHGSLMGAACDHCGTLARRPIRRKHVRRMNESGLPRSAHLDSLLNMVAPLARLVRSWLGIAVALLTLGIPVGADATTLLELLPADSTRAIEWLAAGRVTAVESLFTERIVAAEAIPDRRALARLLRMRGAGLASRSQPLVALPLLTRAVRVSEGLRDTATLVRALRWQAYTQGLLGELVAQRATAERQRQLSRATRDTSYEASALHALGWVARRRGELVSSRALLEAAVAGYRAIGDEANEAFVSATLGSVYITLGHFPLARRTFQRSLELARRQGQAWSEAQALNDLGALEELTGDPAQAATYYRRAYESNAARGAWMDALLSLSNRILPELNQGHRDDAEALSREGLAIADRMGLRAQRAWFITSLAELEQDSGRPHRAAALWRETLALGDTLWLEDEVWSRMGLAKALASRDSLSAAIRLMEDALTRLEPRVPLSTALRLREVAARLLLQDGQALRAYGVAIARLAEAETAGTPRLAMPLALTAAQALVACRRNDEAMALFARASMAWERSRRSTPDAGWREIRDAEVVARLAAAEAELQLVHPTTMPRADREARAFATLQRYKTRTLLERLHAPNAPMPSAASQLSSAALAPLRTHVLREGELLLETTLAPDSSFLFVISRHGARMLRLPGEAELKRKLELVHALLVRPPAQANARVAATVLAGLSQTLRLGEALAFMPQANSVIISPDGILHRAPFEGMLAATRLVVSRSPSASFLVALRARPRATAPEPMLVFVGGREPGDPVLSGAAGEARTLSARFLGVATRIADTSTVALAPGELSGFGVLHLAGHTRADDQHPWRSGLTTRSTSAMREAARLTAEEIVRHPIRADLVVLSSCESGGGRVTSGEGLAGLSTAFLAAGSRAVVATLWPVDDSVTERFVTEFYARLVSGDAVGEALRAAQEALRSSPATAHPFYWAGFVLVGEASTRPTLRKVAFPRSLSPGYLVGVCALLTIISTAFGLHAYRRDKAGQGRV